LSIVGGAVFADLLRALEPYLPDVVLVGGWVQVLYVVEAEGSGARVVRTSDIDLTLSSPLEAGTRSSLVDLLRKGGFEVEAFDGESGYEVWKDNVEVDLLTDATELGTPVEIEGQDGLRVFGYPHQALLRENTRSIIAGDGIDPSLVPGIEVLIPTLPAYIVGKVLSSRLRSNRTKGAKDLAYASEILARESLRSQVFEGLPELLEAYPRERGLSRDYLRKAVTNDFMIREVAAQVIASSGFEIGDDSSVSAQIRTRLSRLLNEGLV